MSIISYFKEKFAVSKQKNAYEEACRRIVIRDFEGELYIAYDNFPVIAAEGWWSASILFENLEKLRNQYLRYTGNKVIEKVEETTVEPEETIKEEENADRGEG